MTNAKIFHYEKCWFCSRWMIVEVEMNDVNTDDDTDLNVEELFLPCFLVE